MTTRNKRKMAALNKENCEEHPRSNLAQNSSTPRSQEDYITQVSEEIEGRVTKRLSKEFSRTENRILGALARLDDFLMNPLLPGHSGTTPEPSRNALNTSQGTNEDDSQNDPRPEAGLFHGQITQNSGPEDGLYNNSWTSLSPTRRTSFTIIFRHWRTSLLFHNKVTRFQCSVWDILSPRSRRICSIVTYYSEIQPQTSIKNHRRAYMLSHAHYGAHLLLHSQRMNTEKTKESNAQ